MKSKKSMVDPLTPDKLHFCGGSKMIMGDYDVYCVCTALIAAYKGAEQIPEKKRSVYLKYLMSEWARLLDLEKGWMEDIEVINK